MKNLFKISLFILALCTLPGLSKAQASFPFTITNNLLCDVTVRWSVHCVTCLPPATQQSIPLQVIHAGSTFTLGAAVFMAASNSTWTPSNTDASVQIIEIGGTNLVGLGLTSPFADSNIPFFSGISYPCTPTLNMSWTPTGVTIF